MKYIIIIGVLFAFQLSNAQVKPKDVEEQSEVVVRKVNDGKTVTEEEIEISTHKEKNTGTDVVDISQTVSVPSNSPFTESKKTIKYTINGQECLFTVTDDGFTITYTTTSKIITAKQSKDHTQFVLDDNGKTAIGYFDQEGDFIVQEMNQSTNSVESVVYKQVK
ncbi:hypothetical protein [Formosa sp. S-31]|uniref:hypothetical protein n=1 Tax=Formosa sp. S-31 TaxID=2790949 RepID=UPI003EB90BEF